jgi:hypothetical protein
MTRGFSYPVTPEVKAALASRPNLASRLGALLRRNRSEKEIVRVLDNLHYDHLEKLVDLLERELPFAQAICSRVFTQTETFQFNQALAEIFLFSYLRGRLGNTVSSVPTTPQPNPDISIAWGQEVLVEVFSPVDFMSSQLFERLLATTLMYLDINLGSLLNVRVVTGGEEWSSEDSLYTCRMPHHSVIEPWRAAFAEDVLDWLVNAEEGYAKVFAGPGDVVRIEIDVDELFEDSRIRMIPEILPGKSTDTCVYFERLTPEQTVRSTWGRRIEKKLTERQCGPPDPGNLRLLVLNFALCDAGRKDFICGQRFRRNFQETVRLIVGDSEPPYDAVIPAQIRIECGFGEAVLIDESRRQEVEQLIKEAGLDTPVAPTPEFDHDDYLEMLAYVEGQ